MMESRPSVFKRAWEMLRARPVSYAVVTILPYVVVLGLPILIGRVVVRFHQPAVGPWDPVTLWQSMSWGRRLLIILAFLASANVPMYLAARGICRLALEQQRNVSISLGAVLADMLGFLPVALLYVLVLGIVTFLGSIFFFVPGLLFASWCALIIPAGVDGQLGALAAIRRGVSLVKPVFGRVLGVYVSYLALALVGREAFIVMSRDEALTPGFFVLLGFWLLAMLCAIAPVNIMFTLLYCKAREMATARLTAAAVGHQN